MKEKTGTSAFFAQLRSPVTASMSRILRWSLCFGAGFLFARAQVLGMYTPFACAWAAAAPVQGLAGAVGGALLGTIFSTSGHGLATACAVLLIGMIRYLLSEWKSVTDHVLFAPICTAAVLLVTESTIGGMLLSGTPAITIGCEVLLAGGGAYFFSVASAAVFRRGGFAAADLTARVGCALTGGVLLGALAPVTIGPISVGHIIALIVILFCASRGTITGGCVSGTAIGTLLALSAGSGGLFPVSYAFTGLITGCFAPLGRFAASVAFTVANGIAVLLIRSAPTEAIYETMVAAILFSVIPQHWWDPLSARILSDAEGASPEYLRRSVVMRLDFASRAIAHVSQSVEEVSRQLTKRCAPTISGVYDRAVEETCASCGLRVLCWQKHYEESMEHLNHLTPILLQHGRVTGSELPAALLAVCKRPGRLAESITGHYEDYVNNEAAEQRITELRSVVSSQFRGLSDMLRELSDSFRRHTVCDEKNSTAVRSYFTAAGMEPLGVVCSNDENERMYLEVCTRHVPKDMKALTKELERICGRRFGVPGVTHSGGQARLTFSERAVYEPEAGVAQHICSGAQLCGDHYEHFFDGCGRVVMVLSDGMGSGGRAAVDSAMTCGILSRLILSGLGYDCALRIINSSLYVKSGDESLATVDIATVDLYTGQVVLRKAGAAIGFLRKGGQVTRVDLASLPAGILQEIQFSQAEEQLGPGDLIVLVSDGAISGESDWMDEKIRKWTDTPQALCEELLRTAVLLRNDGHDDDVTVAALQLKAV